MCGSCLWYLQEQYLSTPDFLSQDIQKEPIRSPAWQDRGENCAVCSVAKHITPSCNCIGKAPMSIAGDFVFLSGDDSE